MTAHRPGSRVLVTARGDPYTGRVGTIANTWEADDGALVYTVQFCAEHGYPLGDHHTAYYLADEVEPA
ncbi:hypothetical protein [Mycobacterium pseudokansasii]|uniref:DUF1918 domain-containing protein n=1 Tax=Mycobacterium pseudokansasii TaxID=2341080 RepID=A0A498QK01_9MYCO|nr:hypothetical protein [Mycobacterium pseudokansasii]VBA46741.1 hypothetical protein LAUMK142_00454 [Mycobacterium pseudokansasii]